MLPDTLNMHFLAMSVLRFLCKTLSKLLKLTLLKTLFHGWFFKNSYIQVKKLYSSKFMRAAKQSELKGYLHYESIFCNKVALDV